MMRGTSIVIKRLGSRVKITLQCNDEDEAIAVSDRLIEAAKTGDVTIVLKTRSGPAPSSH